MKLSIMDRVIQYILERQNEDGGFSLLRGQPSSLEATHYAVQTLKMLNAMPSNAESSVRFLTEDVVSERSSRGFLNLYSIFYVVETLRRLGYPIEDLSNLSKGILATQNEQGGFGVENVDVSTVSELESTYFAATVLTRLGTPFDKGKVLGYVQRLRNIDGGFGRNGYSTLATTYFAIMIAHTLGETRWLNDNTLYPPTQKATHVSAWMNARGVTLRSLGEGGYASEGSARRSMWRCHGRKSVGLHDSTSHRVAAFLFAIE